MTLLRSARFPALLLLLAAIVGIVVANTPIGPDVIRAMQAHVGIPGTVIDVAYRGRGYEHVVECRYGTIRSVFDIRSWPRGSTCAVRIDPAGCIVFPQDTPDML